MKLLPEQRTAPLVSLRVGMTLLRGVLSALAMIVVPAFSWAQQGSHSTRAVLHPGSRPNIVLILVDDLGVEAINSYGGEYHTPRIDQLAREGMRFENAHAMPLCTPSRVRIMTGLENYRNYEAFNYLAPGQKTFANVLKDAGYATGIVGKWQLSGNGDRKGITPEQAGFDEFYLWQLAVNSRGSRYWGPTRSVSGKEERVSPEGFRYIEEGSRIFEEGFGPDRDNNFAIDFIARHRGGPFLLYYPMVLVHDPFVPTPASMDASDAKERFAGMVSYMDTLVGRLVDQIKDQGLERQTILIFTADNGTNRQITSVRNNFTVRGGKGLPTVSGTHVPLVAWGPEFIPSGKVVEGLFDLADVLPTFADLARAPLPAQALDGVSQVPVLFGEKPSVRDSIFMHYDPASFYSPARFVFDARWKLYGDGRFVAVDSLSGIETELPINELKGGAARRYAEFARILRDVQDGPLDHDRFPMCAGRPSLDPNLPAVQAGCDLASIADQ